MISLKNDYCVDGVSMVWQCGIFVFVILILNDNFENEAKDEVASRSPLVVDNYFCVNDCGQFFRRSLLTGDFLHARAAHCKKWVGDTQSASFFIVFHHFQLFFIVFNCFSFWCKKFDKYHVWLPTVTVRSG